MMVKFNSAFYMNTTKNYQCIDLFKYIMAMAVVAIHIFAMNTIVECPSFIRWFIRLAVPFFFIVSGFLMAVKLGKCDTIDLKKTLLKNRAIRLFRIFFLWLIIYIPLSIYAYVRNGNDNIIHIIASYAKSVIFYGESPYSWPLWYIYSMAIVCLLLSFSIKKSGGVIVLLLLSVISYMSNYLAAYSEWGIHHIVAIVKMLVGRTLGGGIYILAGWYLYNLSKVYHSKIQRLDVVLSFLIISGLFFYFHLPFWELFGGLGVALLGFRSRLLPMSIWLDLRYQSMWIYYTHMYIIVLLNVIFPHLIFTHFSMFVCIVYVVCILEAFMLNRIQKIPCCSKISQLIK